LQLQFRSAGLAAGLLTLALAAPALAGPSVTIRVEGKAKTLAEEQRLATPDGQVPTSTGSCSGATALGALHAVVAGDWSGNGSFGTEFVERIRDENYPLGATPDGWTFWVNHREAQEGPCDYDVQEGDDILYLVSRCEFDGTQCANPPVLPLELGAPATGSTGSPGELTVVRYDPQGNAAPVQDARITGPGVNATTGADGKASVTFGQAGEIVLKADKPGLVRSAAEKVAVSRPGEPPVTPAGPVALPDTAAPVARIRGIRSGQRFKRRKAPRTLRGSVTPDRSGLRAVKLSLTRSSGGRCQLYSPTKERFRRSRCGRRVNFSIGDRQDWSYLLPKRLGKGRYVLDVIAVDKLGNRDTLARGRNRVVFFVR
jgi:hypothetical protein